MTTPAPVYLTRPRFDAAETAALAETIESGWVTQGPRTASFEKAFAERVGANGAVAVSSCTTGLFLTLTALGVGPGDEVILCPHSFIASANAVRHCGATPRFVDVAPGTLNIDPAGIAAAITPRTCGVMAIHQIGLPADLPAIASVCQHHGLWLIEDAACAVGSQLGTMPIGKLTYSTAAIFSFHPRKVITTGEGGMITVDDPALEARLRRLRAHGMAINDLERHTAKHVLHESYPEVGFNFRMTDLQAAIGSTQLMKLDAIIESRRLRARAYDEALAGHPAVSPLQEPTGVFWNYQTYLLRLHSGKVAEREALMQWMLDGGIATRRGIQSIHEEAAYAHPDQHFPHASEATRAHLALPLYPDLDAADQERVIDRLLEFWR